MQKVYIHPDCVSLCSTFIDSLSIHKHIYKTTNLIVVPTTLVEKTKNKKCQVIAIDDFITQHSPIPIINERMRILDDIKSECCNTNDPITLEEFQDIDVTELKSVVKIGCAQHRHCLTLDSAFEIYNAAIMQRKSPKDPYNPNHEFTKDEIAEIVSKKMAIDPSFKVPLPIVTKIKSSIRLCFTPTNYDQFVLISITHHHRTINTIGTIPMFIEPGHSGSTDHTSAVLMSNIQQLWDEQRLFRNNKKYSDCVVTMNFSAQFWVRNGFINIERFKVLCEDVADALR